MLSSGEEEVEGVVPEATFFLKAVQWALKPPLILTDLGFLGHRGGTSLAVTGVGSRGNSVAAERSEWSFVFPVTVWRDFAGVGLEGATETERERRRLKRMPSPSPLATVA